MGSAESFVLTLKVLSYTARSVDVTDPGIFEKFSSSVKKNLSHLLCVVNMADACETNLGIK